MTCVESCVTVIRCAAELDLDVVRVVDRCRRRMRVTHRWCRSVAPGAAPAPSRPASATPRGRPAGRSGRDSRESTTQGFGSVIVGCAALGRRVDRERRDLRPWRSASSPAVALDRPGGRDRGSVGRVGGADLLAERRVAAAPAARSGDEHQRARECSPRPRPDPFHPHDPTFRPPRSSRRHRRYRATCGGSRRW